MDPAHGRRSISNDRGTHAACCHIIVGGAHFAHNIADRTGTLEPPRLLSVIATAKHFVGRGRAFTDTLAFPLWDRTAGQSWVHVANIRLQPGDPCRHVDVVR